MIKKNAYEAGEQHSIYKTIDDMKLINMKDNEENQQAGIWEPIEGNEGFKESFEAVHALAAVFNKFIDFDEDEMDNNIDDFPIPEDQD